MRLELLTESFLETLDTALQRVPPEMYARISEHTGQPPHQFEKQFHEFVMGKSLRTVSEVIGQMRLAQPLKRLDIAEERARHAYHQMGLTGTLPPEEQPVHFEQLSIENLVDIRLRRARQDWLSELHDRLERADAELMELETDVAGLRSELASKQTHLLALTNNHQR